MREIHVPAQVWEKFSNKLALMNLSNQKGIEVISVPTFEHQGYLYMGNGACYTPFSSEQSSTVYAYRLLPQEMYTGATTTKYHDEEAIANGSRERGDLTGLIVSVNRMKMVCALRVHFLSTLPTTVPVDLSDALSYDAATRKYGWRAHFYAGVEPEWQSVNGHPVALYVGQDQEETRKVLFWKYGDSIQEMSLSKAVVPDRKDYEMPKMITSFSAENQIQLF